MGEILIDGNSFICIYLTNEFQGTYFYQTLMSRGLTDYKYTKKPDIMSTYQIKSHANL